MAKATDLEVAQCDLETYMIFTRRDFGDSFGKVLLSTRIHDSLEKAERELDRMLLARLTDVEDGYADLDRVMSSKNVWGC